jgi:hypothetical protein
MEKGPSVTFKTSGSHLRGVATLAFESILGVVGMVEAMHGNIARCSPFASRTAGSTRGVKGLVYRSIRGVTHVTGAGVDAALALFDPFLAGEQSTPGRETALAALNGVLGDHLFETANPLAIPMRLRRDGSPLRLDKKSLSESIAAPGGRLAIMVHGLCTICSGAGMATITALLLPVIWASRRFICTITPACTFLRTGAPLQICWRRWPPSGRRRLRNS